MPTNLSGETYKNIMEELLRSALGGIFPGNDMSQLGGNILQGWKISEDYANGVSGYKKELEGELASGSKALNQQRALGIKEIEKSTQNAMDKMRSGLISAGLNNSGVAANGINSLVENETGAKNGLVSQIAGLDEQYRRDALNKLLGIESNRASLGSADRQAERDLMSLISNLKLGGDRNRMMQDELSLKKQAYEEGKTGFGGVLGSILGNLLGITTGNVALGAGDELNNWIFGNKQ
jgi:hypothetical protein